MEQTNRKVLFIDNFDSFTYNLVDDFCKRNCEAKVYRADTELEKLERVAEEFEPDLLVISPGPGTPDSAGVSLAAVDYFKDKLPETPFEILVAQHQEMVPMLDSINSIIETLESGKQDVEVLEELISILEALKDTWHKHIPVADKNTAIFQKHQKGINIPGPDTFKGG